MADRSGKSMAPVGAARPARTEPSVAGTWRRRLVPASELGPAIDLLEPGLSAGPLPSAVTNLDGCYLLTNEAYCRMVGRSAEELRRLTVSDVTHPDDAATTRHLIRSVGRGRLPGFTVEKRYLRPDGRVVGALTHVKGLGGAGGRPVGAVAQVIEHEARDETEDRGPRELDGSHVELLFRANPQPMLIYDQSSLGIVNVNDAACTQYGYGRRDFLALCLLDLHRREDVPGILAVLEDRSKPVRELVARHVCADGSVIDVELTAHDMVLDQRAMTLVSARDVTAREKIQRQLVHQETHDPETGLPNRALLLHRLAQMLVTSERDIGTVGVLYLELDGFHLVYQSVGYDQGDALLREVARRLQIGIPAWAMAARITRYEFAVCAGLLDGADAAEELAHHVQRVIGDPIDFAGVSLRLTTSVGVCTGAQGRDADEMLLEASLAAAEASGLGNGQVVRAGAGPRAQAMKRLLSRHALHHAIESGQMEIYYQPLLSMREGTIAGAEALVRWEHPEQGTVTPADFVPLAEETGLIVPLGRLVLEAACKQAVTWPRARPGTSPLSIAVNVSGRQLLRGNFAALVERVLDSTGLDPQRLTLEVTETVLIKEGTPVVDELHALKALGVRLALDDFGTGYSSLAYLGSLPFDVVKIERSFVTGMYCDERRRAIVAGVISLASSLGLTVVAEGVESSAEAAELMKLGADMAQGYHYFKPMPADRLLAMLTEELGG